MEEVEPRLYADHRPAGVTYTAGGDAWNRGRPRLAVHSGGGCCPWPAANSGVARAVQDDLDRGDLESARARLPALVGRDVEDLGPEDAAAAVVESVAENTVDAVVAPVFWGLAAGTPGVLAHRAVNTLDAMVGHRSDRYRRFGWASARLDNGELAPGRVTALVVAAIRPREAQRPDDCVAGCAGSPVTERRGGRGGLRRCAGRPLGRATVVPGRGG